ncbi:MAG: AAA family ATPase, partial [Lachnospiraceae bacterium]|nr:AAA family ATPase [Lachnospiraceae bacterium]
MTQGKSPRSVAIGVQSFEKLRERDAFMIDKTAFIREWWEGGDDIALITRPRRFGKTLNMNMVECFFSNKYVGRSDLFDGLHIWQDEAYRTLQGTYPVISLTFSSIKPDTFEKMRLSICRLLGDVANRYRFLVESDVMSEADIAAFHGIRKEMDDDAAAQALHHLCDYLERFYGKKVIIL